MFAYAAWWDKHFNGIRFSIIRHVCNRYYRSVYLYQSTRLHLIVLQDQLYIQSQREMRYGMTTHRAVFTANVFSNVFTAGTGNTYRLRLTAVATNSLVMHGLIWWCHIKYIKCIVSSAILQYTFYSSKIHHIIQMKNTHQISNVEWESEIFGPIAYVWLSLTYSSGKNEKNSTTRAIYDVVIATELLWNICKWCVLLYVSSMYAHNM